MGGRTCSIMRQFFQMIMCFGRTVVRPQTVRLSAPAPHPALYGVFFVKRKNAFSSRRPRVRASFGRFAPWAMPTTRPRGAIGSARRRREGNHAAGAKSSRHNLVFGGSCDPDHDALMRIGGEVPRRRTILSRGAKAMVRCGHRRLGSLPARADVRSRREKEAPFQERTGEAEVSFEFGRSISGLTPGRTGRRRSA